MARGTSVASALSSPKEEALKALMHEVSGVCDLLNYGLEDLPPWMVNTLEDLNKFYMNYVIAAAKERQK